LFAQQVTSPLIDTSAVAAERGRNILADRGDQAAIDLVSPLFTGPLRPAEIADPTGGPRGGRGRGRYLAWPLRGSKDRGSDQQQGSRDRANHHPGKGSTPMRIEWWGEFAGLVGSSRKLLATVTSQNAVGTSSLTAYDGSQMRAIGIVGGAITYDV